MRRAGSLPNAVARRLEALRTGSPHPADHLLRLVERHRTRAQEVAAADPFVDLRRAIQVADACIALLDALPTLSGSDQSWVSAACLYFADTDDEEDDFSSVVGFDDDAEVVNHVAARLGLDHIRIDLG